MSRSLVPPTVRRPFSILLLLGLVATSCEKPATAPEPLRHPLEFEYIIQPARIQPDVPFTVRAGVLVGPDGCWKIESAAIRKVGYEIRVEGTAIYAPDGGACAQVVVYDTLVLEGPPLHEVTRYDLIAGSLTDDIYVHPDYVDERPTLIAYGGICPPLITTYSAYVFQPRYPGSTVAGGWLDNPPPLDRCIQVLLYGEVVGWADLARGGLRQVIHISKLVTPTGG
jgi:hypothetical protein